MRRSPLGRIQMSYSNIYYKSDLSIKLGIFVFVQHHFFVINDRNEINIMMVVFIIVVPRLQLAYSFSFLPLLLLVHSPRENKKQMRMKLEIKH